MNNNSRKDRLVRWQTKTIEQFGFVNNLIVGLAVGSLVFAINELTIKDFALVNCSAKVFYGIALILLTFSVFSGVCLSYNRLIDFKLTTRTIRMVNKDKIHEANKLRAITKFLGKVSWVLLPLHLFTFLIGDILLFLIIILTYWYKLN